jgi:hypothetical protein
MLEFLRQKLAGYEGFGVSLAIGLPPFQVSLACYPLYLQWRREYVTQVCGHCNQESYTILLRCWPLSFGFMCQHHHG